MKDYKNPIYATMKMARANLSRIADNIYQQGYEAGKAATPFTDTKEAEDKAYNRGLNEAWDAARKIAVDVIDGGYSLDELREIFDETLDRIIFKRNTASEAIAKIKAYEDEQDAEIKVGDEVKHQGFRSVVVRIADDCIYTISECGTTPKYCKDDDLVKTGRHFDEIAEVLTELRGAENDE